MIDRIKMLELQQSITCLNCKKFLECKGLQDKLDMLDNARNEGLDSDNFVLSVAKMIAVESLLVFRQNPENTLNEDYAILTDIIDFNKQ